MASPRKKKTSNAAPAAAPPLPASARKPRWRMVAHADGVSQVPERILPRRRREREQAVADLYGNAPLPSTGERLLPVSSVLAELLSQLELKQADYAPELLANAWLQAAGEFLASQARLVSLADGVAGIITSHPAVRFEIQRYKKHIIRALNAALGEGSVERISVHHS